MYVVGIFLRFFHFFFLFFFFFSNMVYTIPVYLEFFFFFIFCFGICICLFGMCYLFFGSTSSVDKNIGYECGFDPFSDARDPFFIRFYMVALLFLLFDVELVFFLPAVCCIWSLSFFGFFTFYCFFLYLLLIYYIEWKKCSFDFVQISL